MTKKGEIDFESIAKLCDGFNGKKRNFKNLRCRFEKRVY